MLDGEMSVPMREATQDEIPDAARAAGELLRSRDIWVCFTFAQGGPIRYTARQGECNDCGQTLNLYVETGTVRKHTAGGNKCGATGLPAGSSACDECGQTIKPTKRGLTPSHALPKHPCPGSEQEPLVIMEPKPMPPVSTLALRAWPVTVAVWEDGKFLAAYLCAETFGHASAVRNETEWKKALNGARG